MLLQSCANFGRIDWPKTIPPRQYFQCAYEADSVNQRYQDERAYLNWVIDFYQGSLFYPSGWKDVEEVMLALIPPQQQASREEQFRDLGIAIASEWAKHNDVRLIDNRLLSLWGSILQLSVDEYQLARSIDVISQDIASIRAGELEPAEADESRYEELLELELFEGF